MPRFRRWAPAALLVASVASSGVAVALEAGVPSAQASVGGPQLVTPVVSARRVPQVVAAPIAQRRLMSDLAEWLAAQPPETCLVVTGDDGEISYRHHADMALVPASTAKLLTATAALEELGAGFRFRTTLASPAAADGPVLAGDLYLVGGGDPLLASPDYAARFRRQPQVFTDLSRLAAAVADLGVQRIEGAVVGDESRYDAVRYVASWPQRYVEQDQIGPLSALSVNDGFAAYPLAPDAPGELEPADDPAREAAAVLTRLLEDRGVEVVGEPRSGLRPQSSAEIGSLESPPLSDVVAQLLRESDNSTAELLLKELGLTAGEPSTDGGRRVASEVLAGAGVDLTGVVVADGSGLSLDNRLTCEVVMELLTRDETSGVIEDGLPIAGQTGTLAERFDGTELDGSLRAKTGTLNTVTALTGLVDDCDPPLHFALITNLLDRVVSLELIGAQEELAMTMLEWPRVPDVAVLGPRPLEDD